MSLQVDANQPADAPAAGGTGRAQRSLTVYYDGGCPLCTAEIGVYRNRPGGEAVDWIDASACPAANLAPGLDRDAALGRFHVRREDGALLSGGQAFAALWSVLPGLSWIGRLFQRPGLSWLIDRAYDAFLVVRPPLQAVTRRVLRVRGTAR